MKVRIKKIPPLQAAKIAAAIYGCMSLVFVPFMAIFAIAGAAAPGGDAAVAAGMGIGMMIFMPVMYIIMGFVGTLIGTAIYNLIAGWLGGIELHFEAVE